MVLTKEDKNDIREIVSEVFDVKLEPFATAIQTDMKHMETRLSGRMDSMEERLIKIEDAVNYSSHSFSLLMRDLDETKKRLSRVEEKLGMEAKNLNTNI